MLGDHASWAMPTHTSSFSTKEGIPGAPDTTDGGHGTNVQSLRPIAPASLPLSILLPGSPEVDSMDNLSPYIADLVTPLSHYTCYWSAQHHHHLFPRSPLLSGGEAGNYISQNPLLEFATERHLPKFGRL